MVSGLPLVPGLEPGAAKGPPRPTRGQNAGWAGTRRAIRRRWQLYLLVIAPLAYFAVFKYVPMVNAVIAFKEYSVVRGIWGSEWVGLEHFRAFFENPVFWTLVRNTFLLSAYFLIDVYMLIRSMNVTFCPAHRATASQWWR